MLEERLATEGTLVEAQLKTWLDCQRKVQESYGTLSDLESELNVSLFLLDCVPGKCRMEYLMETEIQKGRGRSSPRHFGHAAAADSITSRLSK
jgi:hypothetical protein